jgi:hypothetical protein
MQTQRISPAKTVPQQPAVVPETQSVSPELAADLAQLERQQRIELDRQRQAELAQLRAVQSYD